MDEMRNYTIIILLMLSFACYGQEERKFIRDGYREYQDENYGEAEIDFRKAEDATPDSYIAKFNTTAALYQQKKFEEAGKRYADLLIDSESTEEQAKLLHNIGNVMMEGQQYQAAIDAYKKSLKLNPDDEDTRYNLAYALEKLREQQQQQQQQQQNEDQKEKEDGQKQESRQDQQKDQDRDEQQQQQQEEQKQQQKQEQSGQQQEISKEEAERLLNAILQKEKEVKEEVDRKKAAATKIRTDKNW